MSKLSFVSFLLVGLLVALPTLAVTTVSLTPGNVSVREGQNFTLTVALNPQGVKNYTAKIELNFPADLLEVQSFSFGNGWNPLSQPGYDSVDNANGVLIKTAGYGGGVSTTATFGTVSFLAKKSGNGTISLDSDSFAFDESSQNVLSTDAVSSSVAVSPKLVSQVTNPTPTPISPPDDGLTQAEESPTASPSEEELVEEVEEVAQVQDTGEPERGNLFAAISSFVSLGTGNLWIGLVVLAAVLVIIFIIQRSRRFNKEQ